ncbi:SsrA-binding protein SmpB [Candidatus Saccharibacteria bacterium]|nr:SsrA-binding protein SmpB [Candidatus Saccharibacteria bacterium]
MAKKSSQPKAITNRRAKFDYELGDDLTVGIVLNGREVRAARDGHVQLKGAYATVKDSELWLTNASFSVKPSEQKAKGERSVDTSPRKLLAHRKQIDELIARKKQGLTIIPLRLLTQGRHIKLVIALGKGKKRYDKRQAIKRRDQDRDTQKILKKFN